MRKMLWILSIVLVVAVVGIGMFVWLHRSPPKRDGAAQEIASADMMDREEVPPLPDISLQVNTSHEVEILQGTPAILTVTLANQRATNAALDEEARVKYLASVAERVAERKLSVKEAAPLIAAKQKKVPIKTVRLGTAEKGWETFVHFELKRSDSTGFERLSWPLQVVTSPESKSLVLDENARPQLRYALTSDASKQIGIGEYSIIAIIDVSDSAGVPKDQWKGRVISRPVLLKVSAMPAQLSSDARAKLNMQKAEFFSATKDWNNALASAQSALAADAKLIRAEMILGEAKEAKGDLRGAKDAYQRAIRLFNEKYPESDEPPRYLFYRLAVVEEQLDADRSAGEH